MKDSYWNCLFIYSSLVEICRIQRRPPVEPNRKVDWGPTGFFAFRIEFELQFLKVNRMPDHQSYIIDRVNLNIGRVGYYEYFISSESDGAILLIQSHMILCNGQLITNRVMINIPVTLSPTTVTHPDQKHRFIRYNVESSVKLVESSLIIFKPGRVEYDNI